MSPHTIGIAHFTRGLIQNVRAGETKVSMDAAETESIRQITSVQTDDSGIADLAVVIPSDTPAGEYVLQFVGSTSDNKLRTINLGVIITENLPTTSLTITGTRTLIGTRPGVTVTGISTGIPDSFVIPRVKVRGKTEYVTGTSRPKTDDGGNFTWQRRGNKKLYVYFLSPNKDARSNRLIMTP